MKLQGDKAIIIAIFICILYAIFDEIHRLFIDGRSGQVMDDVPDGIRHVLVIIIYNTFRNFSLI